MSSVLAIRLARLGDITLLLPSLRQLKHRFPASSLTLMVGLPYEPLARMCPDIDDVIAVDRLSMRDGSRREALAQVWRLVREVRKRRFDLVVDFQGFGETNLIAMFSGGRYRTGLHRAHGGVVPGSFNLPAFRQDDEAHLAETFRRVVFGPGGAGAEEAPQRPTVRVPGPPLPDSRPVALYVGASVPSRRWPPDRFASLGRYVARRWGVPVRVLSGTDPDEMADARRVVREIGPGADVEDPGSLDIPGLVRAIASSACLVSNDSGPMHLGSALGVPTLGIFSESPPRQYRPVGSADRFVHRMRVEEVSCEEVAGVLEEMRAAVGFLRAD